MEQVQIMTMAECVKKIGIISFLKSRILTPMDFYRFFRREYRSKDGSCAYYETTETDSLLDKIRDVIYFTRYVNFKSIEGYDFVSY